MKKILLPLLLLIFLVTGCSADKNSENSPDTKSGQIIVIGMDEFAPMGFTDENGNIVGLDVDLAREATKRLGVKSEFRIINWSNKEMDITSGNIDMIWNGCDIMDDYKRYMTFSKPYMINRQILLVEKGNPQGIHSLGDLTDKIVATQAGSNSETYIDEDEALRKSFAKFRTYRNIKEGFAALSKGEYDVLIIDEIAARYEITKNPDAFEIVEVTVGPVTEFGIGFRKDNIELRDKVQKVFDEMIADGTAKKISEQWFGVDLVKPGR